MYFTFTLIHSLPLISLPAPPIARREHRQPSALPPLLPAPAEDALRQWLLRDLQESTAAVRATHLFRGCAPRCLHTRALRDKRVSSCRGFAVLRYRNHLHWPLWLASASGRLARAIVPTANSRRSAPLLHGHRTPAPPSKPDRAESDRASPAPERPEIPAGSPPEFLASEYPDRSSARRAADRSAGCSIRLAISTRARSPPERRSTGWLSLFAGEEKTRSPRSDVNHAVLIDHGIAVRGQSAAQGLVLIELAVLIEIDDPQIVRASNLAAVWARSRRAAAGAGWFSRCRSGRPVLRAFLR